MKEAIVVGISTYPDNTPKLLASVSEANRWITLLRGNGITVSNPRFDNYATRKQVMTDLKDLIARAKEGDKIFFVYSGHGTIIEVIDHNGKPGYGMITTTFTNSPVYSNNGTRVQVTSALYEWGHPA